MYDSDDHASDSDFVPATTVTKRKPGPECLTPWGDSRVLSEDELERLLVGYRYHQPRKDAVIFKCTNHVNCGHILRVTKSGTAPSSCATVVSSGTHSGDLKKGSFGIHGSLVHEVDLLLSGGSTPLQILCCLQERYQSTQTFYVLPTREQIASRKKSLRVLKIKGPDGNLSTRAGYNNFTREHEITSQEEWQNRNDRLLVFNFGGTGIFEVQGENDSGEVVLDTGFIFSSKLTFGNVVPFFQSSRDDDILAIGVDGESSSPLTNPVHTLVSDPLLPPSSRHVQTN